MSDIEDTNSESTALTNWEERMAMEAKAASEVERPAVSQISLRAGVISYMDQPMPNNKLPCIILGSMVERSWYPEKFDADNIVPPTCFALGKPGEEANLAPHPTVPDDQKQAVTCSNCEYSKWGSAPGSSKGQWCGTRRRLAVIPASALDDPDSLARAEIATMKVPVTSVRNFSTYVAGVSAQYQRPPYGVITEITTKPDPRTQFKVWFTTLGTVDMSLLPSLGPLLDRAVPILEAPFDMTPSAEEEEAPAPKVKGKGK